MVATSLGRAAVTSVQDPPKPFPAGSIRCSHNGIMLIYLCGWGEETESLDKCWPTGKNRRSRWKYRDRNMPVSILNS